MMEEKKEEGWNVPCSDEETEDKEIPFAVVMLYKSIEEKGVLELQVREYRQPKVDALQDECVSVMTTKTADESGSKSPLDDEPEVEIIKHPKSAVTSVFDYDDDDTETCQLPRRAPKLGRVNRKRCATLQNVISDLKRFHDLDSKKEEVEQIELEEQAEKTVSVRTEEEAPIQDSGTSDQCKESVRTPP